MTNGDADDTAVDTAVDPDPGQPGADPHARAAGDQWGEWGAAGEPADAPDEAAVEDLQTPAPQQLCYPTLTEFVSDFLAEVGWVDTGTSTSIWCPEWWRHTAAIVRLDSLHRSFEALRLDPALGTSTWLRDHLDPHMAVLTNPAGPFKGCSSARGHDDARLRVLPCAAAPEGLFDSGD